MKTQCSGCGCYVHFDGGCDDTLVTVIDGSHVTGDIDKKWLEEFIQNARTTDDVFNEHFLHGLVITQETENSLHVTDDAFEFLYQLGNVWLQCVWTLHLRPGLYLFHQTRLRPVCRLYSDSQKAFLTALHTTFAYGCIELAGTLTDWLNDENQELGDTTLPPFKPLHATGEEYNTLAVAVPSRLTSRLSRPSPFLRIAVKDVFSLEGIKTSLCNTAYYRLSEPATSTASIVQALLAQEHHIVGLTKLSSMIPREEPMDAIDFQTAFNPRGDGYQSPAGSSSGSAAAVAAYDWLDCAIDTDTSGSGRRPALVNGVFQFRPSYDSVLSLSGMVQTFPWFDTPVVFARNLNVLHKVVSAWLPIERARKSWGHVNLMYPLDYLPTAVPTQMKLIDGFVGDLVKYLGYSVYQYILARLLAAVSSRQCRSRHRSISQGRDCPHVLLLILPPYKQLEG